MICKRLVDALEGPVGIHDCRILNLPKVHDPRGNLTFIEGGKHVPFEMKRIFYLYDVPGGEDRAAHANKKLQEVLIAANGSFDVVVDDGTASHRFSLNRSYYGLYIPGMIWRKLENFSSGSVCLVLASELYNADDYHRNYDEFRLAVGASP
jgi:dTDP-4-dehydrorhamnose 3,5-epimerase-like enzyme